MDGMEDAHGNELKRKRVDVQGTLQSSSSSPPNFKKIRLSEGSSVSAASSSRIPPSHSTVENIKEGVQFIRHHVQNSGELDNKAKAIRALKEILSTDKKEHAETMVGEGTVSVLIQQLKITSHLPGNNGGGVPAGVEILEECALSLLKSLAKESDSARRAIIEEGAIPYFLRLLKRKHRHAGEELPLRIHRVVLKIFEVLSPKDVVKILVALRNHFGKEFALALLSPDRGVQLSALRIITTFALEKQEYLAKLNDSASILGTQLPVMLSSKHVEVRTGSASAVLELSGTFVLLETFIANGISEAIVDMLCSSDSQCRSLGAQLVTIFTTVRPNMRHAFLNDGIVRPLLRMLNSPNLRRDAALALNSCSVQTTLAHTIIIAGGLQVLMHLFFSPEIQNNPELATMIGGLLLTVVNARDGAARFIKMGGLRFLRRTELENNISRHEVIGNGLWDTVVRKIHTYPDYTTKSLVLSTKQSDDFNVRARCAHALALFNNAYSFQGIFMFNNCLEILLELYSSADQDDQYEAAEALHSIANRFVINPPGDDYAEEAFFVANPKITIPSLGMAGTGHNYNANNPNYDITFSLDNNTRQFQAHKYVLMQASDVFRAMLADNYFGDPSHGVIEVPNIEYSTFKSVMDFIYTGCLPLEADEAYDILPAADYYGLHSLKRICLYIIAKADLVVERVAHVYEFAEKYDARVLMHACILFILEYHEQVRSLPWYRTLVNTIIPEIRRWFPTIVPGKHNGHTAVPTYRF